VNNNQIENRLRAAADGFRQVALEFADFDEERETLSASLEK